MIAAISVFLGLVLLAIAYWAVKHGGWQRRHQRAVGWATLLYGIYLATLTGSYTAFVLPGFGGIALGAGAGAAVGFGTWLALGTIGLATGGVGIALGALSLVGIGALVGGLGGAAGGIGFQTVSYPLVHWAFWVPLLFIGIYLIVGLRFKRKVRPQRR